MICLTSVLSIESERPLVMDSEVELPSISRWICRGPARKNGDGAVGVMMPVNRSLGARTQPLNTLESPGGFAVETAVSTVPEPGETPENDTAPVEISTGSCTALIVDAETNIGSNVLSFG